MLRRRRSPGSCHLGAAIVAPCLRIRSRKLALSSRFYTGEVSRNVEEDRKSIYSQLWVAPWESVQASVKKRPNKEGGIILLGILVIGGIGYHDFVLPQL